MKQLETLSHLLWESTINTKSSMSLTIIFDIIILL